MASEYCGLCPLSPTQCGQPAGASCPHQSQAVPEPVTFSLEPQDTCEGPSSKGQARSSAPSRAGLRAPTLRQAFGPSSCPKQVKPQSPGGAPRGRGYQDWYIETATHTVIQQLHLDTRLEHRHIYTHANREDLSQPEEAGGRPGGARGASVACLPRPWSPVPSILALGAAGSGCGV